MNVMSTLNGFSKHTLDTYFYDTPKPGLELARTQSPFRGRSLESKIEIDPSRRRIDDLVAKQLDELNDKLLRWQPPAPDLMILLLLRKNHLW